MCCAKTVDLSIDKCRVLGKSMRMFYSFGMGDPDSLTRLDGVCVPGRVHVLFWHEAASGTAAAYREEQIEIQVWLAAARYCYALCYVCWAGDLSDGELN